MVTSLHHLTEAFDLAKSPIKEGRPWPLFIGFCILIPLTLGLLALYGWTTSNSWFKISGVEFLTMKINTALCTISSSLALLLAILREPQKKSNSANHILSSAVLLVSTFTLVEYATGFDLGLDSLFLLDRDVTSVFAGRMGPNTAFAFLLTSLCLLWTQSPRRLANWISQGFGFASLAVAVFSLIGYALGAEMLYTLPGANGMALSTSLSLALLSIGALSLTRTEAFLGDFFKSNSIGGPLKIMLGAAAIIPTFQRWVFLKLEAASLLNDGSIQGLFIMLESILLILLVWRCTRMANALSREKEAISAQIKISERQFRSTFAQAAVGIAHVGIDGRWLEVNPKICQILGYSEQELLATDFQSLTHPDDLTENVKLVQQTLAGKIDTFMTEKRYIRKDQTPLWAHLTVSLLRADDMIPQYFIVVIEDIGARKEIERQLKENVRIYRAIGESIDYGVWVCNPDGHNTYASESFLKLVGLTQEECSSFGWGKVLHPDDTERTIAAWQDCVRQGGMWDIEHRFRGVDGLWHPVLARGVPVRDDHGQIVCWAGINLDISRQKMADRAIRESEERFRQLANSMPQIVWTARADGHLDYYNDRWYEYTNHDRKLRGDESWVSTLHPDDLETCRNNWYACVTSGEPLQAEYRFLNSSTNEYRWFLSRALAIRNSKGEIDHWFGTCTDIHDQKSASEAFSQALKDLSDIRFALDQSTILAVTDAKGIINYVNDKFCEISQYSREELLGKSHRLINSGYHSKDFFKDLWNTISAGKIWRNEIQNRAKDGSLYWVDTFIVPSINEDGIPYQYTAIRTDITAKKLSEHERTQLLAREQAALEASRLKSEFLANMSHEIRTPLNAVLGMTDLLLDTPLSEEQHDCADVIKTSTQVLVGLIKDILDFSRIESGKLELESIPFNLQKLIFDVERELQWTARGKNVRLTIENQAQVPTALMGDPTRLRQIIANLLSNGIKFTENGAVTLRTKIEKETEQKMTLKIEVEDTGIGLDGATVSRLFEAFVQSDSSTTRKYGGTGLGLSICKKLVELMNGEIGVESQLGVGSTFWVRIHLLKLPPQQRLSMSESRPRDMNQLFRLGASILLVEDIAVNQKVATLLLSKFGLTADVVSNGREALSALQEKSYDLILMDCHMPEMDGYEATRAIRESTSGELKKVPIVAMTAGAMTGDREACLEAGMDDYLAKPISKEVLGQCLQRWLKPIEL